MMTDRMESVERVCAVVDECARPAIDGLSRPRANRGQHIADSSDLSESALGNLVFKVISFRAHSQLRAEFGERPELVQVQQEPVEARQVKAVVDCRCTVDCR
ncbi:unnamed protein product [Anisakis simplex]|uniref:ArsR family transcriptional regulator n=1 Tax=Anisakis simplex TaxID=6269 RepID=A0A0M3KB21_ANISI|nr:unnamed protein product [Anisakis simplex]